MARSARSRRNQQILSIILSVIVVLSMGLSLVTVLTPNLVQPTATFVPLIISPPLPATPTPTPVVSPTP